VAQRHRRHLLRLLTLAIAGACLSSPAQADAACSATPACLEATFPLDYAWPPLDAGAAGNESAELVVTVTSNEPWGLTIASDLADGRMKEWTGSAYVTAAPKALTHPLEWSLSRIGATPQTVSYGAISSTAAVVVSGRPSTCPSACGSEEIATKYRQLVSFADASAGINDYRISVVYEAGQGF
jgi:hypothetical protein